jgi:16S rRNA (guanine966-N2)-methyltransferase
VTRIIAGAARGRRLAVPPGRGTRPTADRAREGLFSALESVLGTWSGVRVLDLYAGSGAVGLEALSRGAAAVLLVESDAAAARTVRANAEALGLPGAAVVTTPVQRLVRSVPPGAPYGVVFADPPYEVHAGPLRGVLTDARRSGWLTPDAVVVVERASRDEPWTWPTGFQGGRSRRYGEATLWYGRADPDPGPPPTSEV